MGLYVLWWLNNDNILRKINTFIIEPYLKYVSIQT